MDSPMDPGSPTSSASSPGTPPPDEPSFTPSNSQTSSAMLGSSIGSTPSKRRLPGGSGFGATVSSRDAKSRRREEGGSRRQGQSNYSSSNIAAHGVWGEGKERRKEEDLVDVALAESLKKQIGDPFDEIVLKTYS